MPDWTAIDQNFWKSPDLKKCTSDEKLLFLYLMTSPHRNIIGLYHLPLSYALEDIGCGWDVMRLSKAIDGLSGEYILYDDTIQYVFIINFLKPKHNPLQNSNQVKCAITTLRRIPVTPLFTNLLSVLSTSYSQVESSYLTPFVDFVEERVQELPVFTSKKPECNEINILANPSERVSKPFRNNEGMGMGMGKSTSFLKEEKEGDFKEGGKEGVVLIPEVVSEHQDFIRYFDDLHKAKFRLPYDFKRGKDGNVVKRLLKRYGYERLRSMAELFFLEEDDWLRKAGYTLGTFSARASAIAQGMSEQGSLAPVLSEKGRRTWKAAQELIDEQK